MNKTLLSVIAVVLLVLAALPVSAAPDPPSGNTPYYQVEVVTLPDGQQLEKTIIGGPPHPPAGYARATLPVDAALPDGLKQLSGVPTYEWSFGCSATSASMIAGYYDRNAHINIYTGPTDGGLIPMSSTIWGFWTDGAGVPLPQCPLTASRLGLDVRTSKGSIDDYFISHVSTAADPYIGKWTQHTWGDAIGDYMKTSQSAYGNPDGATSFYNWTGSSNPLTCEEMLGGGIQDDGTVGRMQFYEARGYSVTACYNQPTGISTGFTFSKYIAEIDAGRPVMLNLTGHTVVGIGYDDSISAVYFHDTWDQSKHAMTWGGSYAGMAMESVSIVNLACPDAGNASHLAVAKSTSGNVKLTWYVVPGADHYEVWSAVNAPYFTPGTTCASPAPYACQTVKTPPLITAALGSTTANNTFAVRAVNVCGGKSTALLSRVGEFEFALTRP